MPRPGQCPASVEPGGRVQPGPDALRSRDPDMCLISVSVRQRPPRRGHSALRAQAPSALDRAAAAQQKARPDDPYLHRRPVGPCSYSTTACS